MREHCLLCSSTNYFSENAKAVAWECWNCEAKYWIDDLSRIEYMAFANVSYEVAEQHLSKGLPNFVTTQPLP